MYMDKSKYPMNIRLKMREITTTKKKRFEIFNTYLPTYVYALYPRVFHLYNFVFLFIRE